MDWHYLLRLLIIKLIIHKIESPCQECLEESSQQRELRMLSKYLDWRFSSTPYFLRHHQMLTQLWKKRLKFSDDGKKLAWNLIWKFFKSTISWKVKYITHRGMASQVKEAKAIFRENLKFQTLNCVSISLFWCSIQPVKS